MYIVTTHYPAMRILALEPYYGGSHQAFLDQWIERSEHQWQLLTLPAHHWKWRMRHAAIWFADQAQRLWNAGQRWDVVFCSDMLDLAQFLGLAGPHIAELPHVIYFHENQLTYPTRFDGERDLHFAMTNFTSALAAHQVWFNSAFHRRSFLDAAQSWLAKMPDFVPAAELAAIEQKSSVQSPGIDVAGHRHTTRSGPIHIAWAARWEHDKNPKTLFDALLLLQQQKTDFQLTVCGQTFRDVPPEFQTARKTFADQINHWGPLPSRADFLNQLSQADIFVSTAIHEFFGLAVMESIALGLYPLLPKRLSYPELLGTEQHPDAKHFFYDGSATDLARQLSLLAHNPDLLRAPQLTILLDEATQRYAWPRRATAMDSAITTIQQPREQPTPSSEH